MGEMNVEKTSLKRNLILNYAYQILVLIVPLITAPYVSRVLGAKGIGTYSFTNSIQIYFSMFAALGTASYGSREIARVRNDKDKRSQIFWEIEILTIITSLICLSVWAVFIIVVNSNYKIYFIILSLNILSTMMDISWLYTGLEQFSYMVRQNTIFKILSVILIFVFVKGNNDLAIYILILSLSTLLGTISMWIYLPKFIKPIKLHTIKLKKHFHETLIYFIPTIATSVYTVLDKTLIGVITHNVAENGYYEQASKIINACKAVTFSSLNTVLGSRISFLYAENRIKEITERINYSMNYIMFIGIGFLFGIIGESSKLVPIYFGAGFESVINTLKFMSPLILIIGISGCLGSLYYNPAGLRKKSAKYIIIGSIINLICNLTLIPKFGNYGAVMGTLVAETTITILFIVNSRNIIKSTKYIAMLWKKIIAGTIMLLIIQLFDIFIKNDIVAILVETIIGAIIYILILMILHDDFITASINKVKNWRKSRGEKDI